MKYKTLLADPPWPEQGGGKIKRGADRHYPLMSVRQICAMAEFVTQLSDENSHLYLWVTNNHLKKGLHVMNEWGFRYITTIVWVKTTPEGILQNPGLGQYFQGSTELCLFGVKGRLPYRVVGGKKQRGKTVILAPRKRHSEKPEELHLMAEAVSYSPRVELFARHQRQGWDVWGNEVEISPTISIILPESTVSTYPEVTS